MINHHNQKGYILTQFISYLSLSIILLSISMSLWQVIQIRKVYLDKKKKVNKYWELEEKAFDYQLKIFFNNERSIPEYEFKVSMTDNESIAVLQTKPEDDEFYLNSIITLK